MFQLTLSPCWFRSCWSSLSHSAVKGLAETFHGLANQESSKWLIDLKEFHKGERPNREKIQEFINKTQGQKTNSRYGHSVLRNIDPRFMHLKGFADQHIKNDIIADSARQCLNTIHRILGQMGKIKNSYPSVDAFSGVCLQHYGHLGLVENEYQSVVFAVSRAIGVLINGIWSVHLASRLKDLAALILSLWRTVNDFIHYHFHFYKQLKLKQFRIFFRTMTIYSLMIAVENPTTKQVVIVQRDYQLDAVTWALRSNVKDSFKFLARESLPCLAKHTRHTVAQEDKLCHIQVAKKPVAAYAFVDKDYPKRVVFLLLNKVLEVFFEKVGDKWQTYTEDLNLAIKQITQLFEKYQTPEKVDKLTQALKEVEDTKVVLHESVRKLLQVQGDLDDLVVKSKDLSQASKQFYKNSKKMNKSCCQLI